QAFPTLVGDMDNSGRLNAQVLHLLGERIRTKAVFQTHQAKFVTWQFDGEYRGDDCTATLTLGNPDLLGESASPCPQRVLVPSMSHASLSHHLLIPTTSSSPARPAALAVLVPACPGPQCVPIPSSSPPSLPSPVSPQVQVGVELEANTRLQDTTFAFGYQLNLPQANMVFRGLLDSNWSVGAVLEKKLPPLPVTLALGAFLNHWKNRFHCGFSVIVG
ncbi:Mitochondrial import receptor subunit TOM40B, partial [Cuculus canorus]